MDTSGNQTMNSESVMETNDTASISNLILYSNPNLVFTLEYPSDWQKEESLSFVSPQGWFGNRFPEVISILTEVLPTSDYSMDRCTEATLGHVESLQANYLRLKTYNISTQSTKNSWEYLKTLICKKEVLHDPPFNKTRISPIFSFLRQREIYT